MDIYYHSKTSCRAGCGTTTDERQIASRLWPSRYLPKVCLRSTLAGAKCVLPARSVVLSIAHGSSVLYFEVIKCTYIGANKISPCVCPFWIAFIVNWQIRLNKKLMA